MTVYFVCYNCNKAAPLLGAEASASPKRCPLCGSAEGDVYSEEQFEMAREAGAIFDVDMRTGTPAKKKAGVRSSPSYLSLRIASANAFSG